MSIAIIKKPGVKVPDKKLLSNCWNRVYFDGSTMGYAFLRDEKFYLRRGFVFLVDFEESLKNDRINSNDVLMIYFRKSKYKYFRVERSQPLYLTTDEKYLSSNTSSSREYSHI